MTFFTQEKGTLFPEKGHLAKRLGPAPPPIPTPQVANCVNYNKIKLKQSTTLTNTSVSQ
jgi:hypothetical protein